MLKTAVTLLAAGTMLAGSVLAQQTPAAKPATAKAATTTTATKAPAKAAPAELKLETSKQKGSYAIGASVGKSLVRDSVDVDTAILLRGLKDALAGGKMLLNEDDIRAALADLQKESRAKNEEKMKALGEENKKAGEAFLAANKTKEGVVTLPSGLQYKVLKQGDGPKPTSTDTVECNYRGTLIDGKEFDSSYSRKQTATFAVTRVIKGWTEILQMMPVGSKYQIFVPSELAYGPQARSAEITPNSTLIFEIELVSIKPNTPAPAAAPKPADAPKPEAAPKAAEPAK